MRPLAPPLQGCQSLRRLFLELDVGQLSRLREQLLAMQAEGLDVEPKTWVAKLLQPKHQCATRVCRVCRGRCVGGCPAARQPHARFSEPGPPAQGLQVHQAV